MKQRQDHQALRGNRIVVPESRELDRFSAMLEKHGANVLRSPLILVRPLEDMSALDGWMGRLIAGGHDTLAFYTGEGVAHIVARAQQLGLRAEVLTALGKAQKIARGPKPSAALRKVGLSTDLAADAPTTNGLLETLEKLPLQGRCVAVQLYPGAPEDRLREALDRCGAGFDPVLPYRYVSDESDEEVASVIRDMANGTVDLIAFTSKLQVQRLLEVAKRKNIENELQQALKTTMIAAVGPMAAAAVENAGGTVAIQPTSSFHLKPLVTEIVRVCGSQG